MALRRKVKVPLHRQANAAVAIDPDATYGAQVGATLFWPDGTVVQAADILTQPQSGGQTITDWTRIRSIPPDVTALANIGTTGLYVITGDGTSATRTLTGPAAGLAVADGDGVAGNPTLSLANDLEAVEGLGGTGFAVRTAADTWAQRSIAGTAGRTAVTNGDGVAGNTTVDLATLSDSGVGAALVRITRDAYGRVAGTQAASTSDLTEGSNLYFTGERAQDAVGSVLVDSATVNFTYDDVANTITAAVIAGGVDHGSLAGLSDNDHPQYPLKASTETISGAWTFSDTLTATGNCVFGTDSANDHTLNGDVSFNDELTVVGQFSSQGDAFFSGIFATLGSTTLGNAATDALTINCADVTNPNGLTFSGALTANAGITTTTLSATGNVTLGDASGDTITVNAGTLSSGSNACISHGTYTPTLTAGFSNVASSTAYQCQYLRVGDTVTVSGQFAATASATLTGTIMRISLPISSAFANSYECGGTAANVSASPNGRTVAIRAHIASGTAEAWWYPITTNPLIYHFSFTYRIV